ncbi:hypothetical protein GXM_03581 [Nostoc sphaeroides CCNUC1]|uniref:Uncharacterized protein n=1 Tax=Nostoc sphaeroides CCNUC1 TaxID=2653204 RepID=A0A5P8W0G5_9NOSO|nr:hypothetical protein GXM_03581 [Nostoc sphaeroides CCNUC1]
MGSGEWGVGDGEWGEGIVYLKFSLVAIPVRLRYFDCAQYKSRQAYSLIHTSLH